MNYSLPRDDAATRFAMTASPQGSTGEEPGRRKLMTYGKASRKRPQSSPISNNTFPRSTDSFGAVRASSSTTKPSKDTSHAPHLQDRASSPPKPKAEKQRAAPLQNAPAAVTKSDQGTIEKRNTAAIPATTLINHASQVQEPLPEARGGLNLGSTLIRNNMSKTKASGSSTEGDSATATASTAPSSRKLIDRTTEHIPNNGGRKRASSPAKQRRPRLIDTLAAQKEASPEPNVDTQQSDTYSDKSQPDVGFMSNSQRTSTDRDARSRQDHRSRDTPKRKKVRYTYSQSRRFLGDSQTSGGTEVGESDPLLLEALLSETPRAPSPDAFDFADDIDNDASSKTTIRSVHELRRAGAHTRFGDEMEDLLFRIGTPNCDALTMRRNALLELAGKLEQAEFITQFRNHAARDKIAQSIGKESDIICSVALAAVLIIFLSSGTAPHLLRQLAEEEVGKFLGRMLHMRDDLNHIAAQRTTNLSKSSRASVDQVAKSLANMKIWHGFSIQNLTPRILALEMLEIFFRVAEPQHLEIVAGVLESELLLLAEQYAQQDSEDPVGIALLVSIFEAHSSATSVLKDKPKHALRLAPLMIKLLPGTLETWPQPESEAESSTLKLAINMTNTAAGAAALNSGPILKDLVRCIDQGFSNLQNATAGGRMTKDAYDSLLVVLGIMINIMEHCSPARQAIEAPCIDTLASLYLTNHNFISKTGSDEKSQLTIPFGYLSVLLGYLALDEPAGKPLSAKIRLEGVQNIVATIQQLISLYNNSGNDAQELENLANELRRKFRLLRSF
jgi:hypothetical protein